MPVRRFKSLDEAERALWLEPGDPRIWEGLLRRWELHRSLGRPVEPRKPGVYRYPSVAEKQRAEPSDPRPTG